MAYKLCSMVPLRLLAALSLTVAVAACAPELGPPPPGYVSLPAPGEPGFRASEFAWSQQAGANSIVGRLVFAKGPAHYTCQGSSVT